MIKNQKNRKRTGAFTLIELLIVVAIIAILAAIAVPNFLEAQVRAKVSRVTSDLRTVAMGMEQYYLDEGSYPRDYDGMGMGENLGEAKVYRDLTTPIAYLNTVPLDVFRPLAGGGDQNQKVDGYYEYWGMTAIKKNNPTLAAQWGRAGLLYAMNSWGPDMDNDNLASQAHTQTGMYLRVYDPSNGTKSGGDIAWSNKGKYPQ